MEHTWGYVAAGYGITTVTLAAYALWLRARSRRIGRSLSGDDG